MYGYNLSEYDVDQLLTAAIAAPSMHNTQPWRFRVSSSAIDVHLAQRRRGLAAGPPDAHPPKTVGFLPEPAAGAPTPSPLGWRVGPPGRFSSHGAAGGSGQGNTVGGRAPSRPRAVRCTLSSCHLAPGRSLRSLRGRPIDRGRPPTG